jgi:hypothetical protein
MQVFTDWLAIGLPKDFIEMADRELGLDGQLVSYIAAHEMLKIEQIRRFKDPDDGESFFSAETKSPLWDAYYADGKSGARYTVLVEYYLPPGVRFETEETRRTVYLEYKELYDRAMVKYFLENATSTPEMRIDFAMSQASHKIMIKYGISHDEMAAIISEGTDKWAMNFTPPSDASE